LSHAHDPAPGDLRQRREADVLPHRVLEDQALSLAVLRDDDDAGADGIPRPSDANRASVPEHRAGTRGADAAEDVREPRPARADEAGDAEHLAGVQLEADRLDVRAQRELARLEHDTRVRRLSRRPLADVASHHQADQLVRGESLYRPRRDDAPVLQYR